MSLRMHPMSRFAHPNGYRAQQYRCPLLFPVAEPGTCYEHKQFAKQGCTKHINVEPGGLLRIMLDRESPLYQAIYRQRTSCERINSQAKELGIERPRVRNRRSVSNLNTLTYIFINTRTFVEPKRSIGNFYKCFSCIPLADLNGNSDTNFIILKRCGFKVFKSWRT